MKKSSSNVGSERENTLKNSAVKKVICIRAQHLFNITLTATTIDLLEYLQEALNKTYQDDSINDQNEERSMLSILNQTGYQINIYHFIGIEVLTIIFFIGLQISIIDCEQHLECLAPMNFC